MTVFIYIPEPCRNCKRNVTVCKQAECSINFYRKFSYMRMRSCDLYTKCDESFPEHTIYTVLTTQGSLRVCVCGFVCVLFLCVCVSGSFSARPVCAFNGNKITNGLWILCLQKPTLLFCLVLSAEDSNGCQNIVEFDILTLLESQARGCQFTEKEREAQCLIWGLVCLTSLFPRHLTTLSLFSCKTCIILSFTAYNHCACMIMFLGVCAFQHLHKLKVVRPMKY